MRLSNMILFADLVYKDDLCETKEEKCLLRGALIAAIKWGERIDAENEAKREKNKHHGVTFKTFPSD